MFLQTSLFLVFPYAVDNCVPFSSKSSLTLSRNAKIHNSVFAQSVAPLFSIKSAGTVFCYRHLLRTQFTNTHENATAVFNQRQ